MNFWLSAMAAMGFCVIALIAVINLIHSSQVDRQINDALDEMIETVESVRSYSSKAEEIEAEIAAQEAAQAEMQENNAAMEGPDGMRTEEQEGAMGHGGKKKKQWWNSQFSNEGDADTESTDASTADISIDSDKARIEAAALRSSAMNQYSGRLSVISFGENNSTQVAMSDSNVLTEEEALEIANQILAQKVSSGDFDEYRFKVKSSDGTTWVYFLDCTTERLSQQSLLHSSILIAAGGLVLTGLFVYLMSKKAIKPLKESMDLQKRFITDAGHELKTPLSVIGTNMDILEMDTGKNEWVDGTKKQVSRLGMLVANLISLSKLEEMQEEIQFQQVIISDIAEECIDAFMPQAEMKGKKLQADISPNLFTSGDTTMVGQLFTILCDNAIKYAKENIYVRLYSSGKKVIFETENDWNHNLSSAELEKLFDRFYRGDSSRSNDDGKYGYGLGLSIAKALAEKNRAQLTVEETPDGHIRFRVAFKK